MGPVRPRQTYHDHDYSTNLFSQHKHLFYTNCATILSERCHLQQRASQTHGSYAANHGALSFRFYIVDIL